MASQRWILDGQRALVTGASAGIGLAICRELLGLGAQVLMVARDAELLEQARAELEDDFPGPEDAVLALPGCHLHLYGKVEAKRGRKMGHLNITGTTPEAVRATAL